jgi:Protein of unknown function (DUF3341)
MADTSNKKARSANVGMVAGWFATPADLYHACEHFRDQGYRDFDAYTPFPVHGLERAMGLKPSRLPWIVLTMGTIGLISAFGMQWWMGGVDYVLNISGKPPFAFQSSVPIGFELTVLLSSFGAFFGLWALNKLPMPFHPVMQHPSFHKASDDRFFLAIEATDPKFDAAKVKAALEKLGAHEVEEVAP